MIFVLLLVFYYFCVIKAKDNCKSMYFNLVILNLIFMLLENCLFFRLGFLFFLVLKFLICKLYFLGLIVKDSFSFSL